jgi:hypothetical protein
MRGKKVDARQLEVEQQAAENELNEIVDELWLWYQEEVTGSIRGLIGTVAASPKERQGWLRAFIVDASTAIKISSARWIVVVDAVRFKRLMDPALEPPKTASPGIGGESPLQTLLLQILARITNAPARDNAFARSLAAVQIQSELMQALGDATMEYVRTANK